MIEHDVSPHHSDLRRLFALALDLLSEPGTADAFATFANNYRTALEAHGFSRQEAVGIVAAHRVPSIASTQSS